MPTQSVLSLRLPDEEKVGLERLARRQGRSVSELAARMVVEGRRREEFAWIDFRDTPAGRVALIQGSRVQVWWVARLVRKLDGDPARVAEQLGLALAQVKAALNYAEAFPEEIEAVIADYEAVTVETLKRELPHLEVFAARRATSRKIRK